MHQGLPLQARLRPYVSPGMSQGSSERFRNRRYQRLFGLETFRVLFRGNTNSRMTVLYLGRFFWSVWSCQLQASNLARPSLTSALCGDLVLRTSINVRTMQKNVAKIRNLRPTQRSISQEVISNLRHLCQYGRQAYKDNDRIAEIIRRWAPRTRVLSSFA
ncbi:hypothetical protein K474DRAFT_1676060 [Panus rudis PR-1116 ss-1]|nr:hypothetical protein K474DRAFT_1676060 [Panus rudis PR-1116 ss-1]